VDNRADTETVPATAAREHGTIGFGAAVHDVYPGPEGKLLPVCGTRMSAPLVLTDTDVTCRHCLTARPSPGARLLYVVLSTDKLEECLSFYAAVGLVFARERHGDGPVHYSVRLSDGIVLELYPAGGRGPSGPRRFGIVLPPTGGPGGRHVLRDPDGRAVDAITPGPNWTE
jgi:hypothetical protein